MENKIIIILNNIKNNLSRELDNRIKEVLSPAENLFNKLIVLQTNPLDIRSLSIIQLKNNLLNIDADTIKKLEMYQKLSQLEFFPLTKGQEEEISTIAKKITDNIVGIKDDLLKSDDVLKELNQKIEKINSLIIKLEKLYNSQEYIKSEDIIAITEALKLTDTSLEEQIKIIQELALTSINLINSNEELDEEENIIEIEETNLNIDDVVALFGKYGYKFDDFNEKSQEEILHFGKIKNMEDILEVIGNHNISLHIELFDEKISQILIGSDGSIVSTIINNLEMALKNTTLNESLQNLFELHLNKPSLFIRGKREYKRRTLGVGGGRPPKETKYSVGSFDNYKKNIDLFIEQGIDIVKAMKECLSVFSYPNKVLRENIDGFKFYRIPEVSYKETLSSLKTFDSLSSIDQFIELGCYQYVLSNFSRICEGPNSLIIYRIVRANQLNEPIYSNKKTKKIQLSGKISDNKQNGYGINYNNRSEQVEQYTPTFNPKYDEIVNNDRNVGPILLAYNNFFIKVLENTCKIDEHRYEFNGIIISRFKVLRIYETLIKNHLAGTKESVLYAICKNSILTEEQYKNIVNCLDMIYGKNLRGVSRL